MWAAAPIKQMCLKVIRYHWHHTTQNPRGEIKIMTHSSFRTSRSKLIYSLVWSLTSSCNKVPRIPSAKIHDAGLSHQARRRTHECTIWTDDKKKHTQQMPFDIRWWIVKSCAMKIVLNVMWSICSTTQNARASLSIKHTSRHMNVNQASSPPASYTVARSSIVVKLV